jgi:hypothetical protein
LAGADNDGGALLLQRQPAEFEMAINLKTRQSPTSDEVVGTLPDWASSGSNLSLAPSRTTLSVKAAATVAAGAGTGRAISS